MQIPSNIDDINLSESSCVKKFSRIFTCNTHTHTHVRCNMPQLAHYPFRFNSSHIYTSRLPHRISRARNICRRAIGEQARAFRSRGNGVRKATWQRRARGKGNPVSHSDIHNMDPFGVIATRKPLVSVPSACRSPPPLSDPPQQTVPRSCRFLRLGSLRRQLDSLSPHILCLICQPKPSGLAGPSGGDGSSTSLFSHCISTPADINHGEKGPTTARISLPVGDFV